MIRPRRLVASDTSIDGSLVYGDLPAPDGAETADIAEALSELGSRPQPPKSPHLRVGVEHADVDSGNRRSVTGVTRPSAAVDLIASTVGLGENSVVWEEPHRDLEWIVERRTAI